MCNALPWPFWRPARLAGLAGPALAQADATPDTAAPRPRPRPAAWKRSWSPPASARKTQQVVPDLHHRPQPGRSRQAQRQDHRRPEICQPLGLYRAHRLPPGHAEHHHPRPAQFRCAVGRRQSGPGLRHRLGGLQGRGLLCARPGPDRLAVRPRQCRGAEGPAGHPGGPQHHRRRHSLQQPGAGPGLRRLCPGHRGRLCPRRPAGRRQYAAGRHVVPARGAEFGKPEGLYRQLFLRSRHRGAATPRPRWASRSWRACSR